jgi:putative ABC transport system ATP-binding protein
VADEPTGNLDEATGSEIVDLMFARQAARGATFVLVTHDPALAARCDRVIRLRSGHVEPGAYPGESLPRTGSGVAAGSPTRICAKE